VSYSARSVLYSARGVSYKQPAACPINSPQRVLNSPRWGA